MKISRNKKILGIKFFVLILFVLSIALPQKSEIVKAETNTAGAGIITKVAGTGAKGYSGDGGDALKADIAFSRIAVDGAGNIYITDSLHKRIREVAAVTGMQYGISMTAGNIYTIAGTGTKGYSGDGGPAVKAELRQAAGIAVDNAGNIYFNDSGNYRIRKIDSSGIITTFAGNGIGADYGDDEGEDVPAVQAKISGDGCFCFLVDNKGNLYFTEDDNAKVREVAAVTGMQYGISMKAGNIYTIAGNGTYGYSGDGGSAASAKLYCPDGIALDRAGNLYIADDDNYRVRKVDNTSGIITTAAGNGTKGYTGDGASAVNATMCEPNSVVFDRDDNLLISDWLNYCIRKVDSKGIISTIAGGNGAGSSGDGGPAASAKFKANNIVMDNKNNLYIADYIGNTIRCITLGQSSPVTTAPALTADSSNNTVGQSVDLTFKDDTAWRGAVTGVTVNGKSVDSGKYSTAAGKITIDGSVFTAAGDYKIAVQATGYNDAEVTQTIQAAPVTTTPIYKITPVEDASYQVGSDAGITTLTVNSGVSGLKYFSTKVAPVKSHQGNETVVFAKYSKGMLIDMNATTADFDTVSSAESGFNVNEGDVIKIYVVDQLTNDTNVNPVVFQQ
ncbi:NHL repeat protein [Clostridium ragsdalei P11]|uniref:NHL repeat protein n=1 Tax=Clostridium ragsdalei P11 TaxID=1353534 RepID=A0A1A6AL11_9CLOT|nr:hemoblobin-interacting domain-containing protein [Clostridium ragsdalei]OBR90770.1 NHL repeat protein [Clostridium ragsdalei P11]